MASLRKQHDAVRSVPGGTRSQLEVRNRRQRRAPSRQGGQDVPPHLLDRPRRCRELVQRVEGGWRIRREEYRLRVVGFESMQAQRLRHELQGVRPRLRWRGKRGKGIPHLILPCRPILRHRLHERPPRAAKILTPRFSGSRKRGYVAYFSVEQPHPRVIVLTDFRALLIAQPDHSTSVPL